MLASPRRGVMRSTLTPPPQRRHFTASPQRAIGLFNKLFGSPDQPEATDTSHYVSRDELGARILAQDPKRRIAFFPPATFLEKKASFDWQRNMYIRSALRRTKAGDVKHLSMQVLPFWTVAWPMEVNWLNYMTGSHDEAGSGSSFRRGGSRTAVSALQTVMGATVCAVDRSHWAHGLMLEDSILTHFQLVSYAASTDLDVYPDLAGRPRELNLIPPSVDPAVAEPFAFGPPLFATPDGLRRLMGFQSGLYDNGNIVQTLNTTLRKRHPPIAFPHYRFVYRAEMEDGSVAFCDPTSMTRGARIVPADEQYPINRRRYSPYETDHKLQEGIVPGLFPWYRQSREWEDLFKTHLVTAARVEAWQATVVADMTRSELNWHNPSILAPHGVRDGQTPAGVINAWLWALLNGEDAPTPAIIPAVAQVAPKLSTHLDSQPEPEPAREPRGPEAAPPPPRHHRQLRSRGTDNKTSRDRLINDRLRSTISNQRVWASQLNRDSTGATPFIITMTDRRKYYKALGLKPRIEFLSIESAEKVDSELKGVFYALTRQHHPDLATDPEDEDRRHDIMSQINVAYAHVETLELRRHYHDPIMYPQK